MILTINTIAAFYTEIHVNELLIKNPPKIVAEYLLNAIKLNHFEDFEFNDGLEKGIFRHTSVITYKISPTNHNDIEIIMSYDYKEIIPNIRQEIRNLAKIRNWEVSDKFIISVNSEFNIIHIAVLGIKKYESLYSKSKRKILDKWLVECIRKNIPETKKFTFKLKLAEVLTLNRRALVSESIFPPEKPKP